MPKWELLHVTVALTDLQVHVSYSFLTVEVFFLFLTHRGFTFLSQCSFFIRIQTGEIFPDGKTTSSDAEETVFFYFKWQKQACDGTMLYIPLYCRSLKIETGPADLNSDLTHKGRSVSDWSVRAEPHPPPSPPNLYITLYLYESGSASSRARLEEAVQLTLYLKLCVRLSAADFLFLCN